MNVDVYIETGKLVDVGIPLDSKEVQESLIEAIDNEDPEAIKEAINLASRVVGPENVTAFIENTVAILHKVDQVRT